MEDKILSEQTFSTKAGELKISCLTKPASPSDGWRVVDDDYGQAVGKLQAESMMSTAASFSLN
jgi:hypothetical protein